MLNINYLFIFLYNLKILLLKIVCHTQSLKIYVFIDWVIKDIRNIYIINLTNTLVPDV